MRKFLPGNMGLIASLENEDPAPAPDAAALPDNAESVETDLAEVTDSEAEGDDTEEQLDEAAEVSEALESYKVALESAISNGGLDRAGATVLALGLKREYDRVGFHPQRRHQIATESFGGSSTKLNATQIALENIKEQIKKIWDAIVAGVKKAVAWVKEHFLKVFGTAQKLEARAKSLSGKAGAITGSAKEKTFENERLVKALNVGGTVPATISSEIEKIKKIAGTVFGQIADFGTKDGEALLAQLETDSGKIDDLVTRKEVPANTSQVSNPDGEGFGDMGEGMALYRSAEMLGGKALIARTAASDMSGTAGIAAAGRCSTSIGPFNPKATAPTKNTVTTLNPSEAAKASDGVADIAKEVIDYKAKLSKLNDIQTKIAAAAEKVGKNAKEEEDKEKSAYLGGLQKYAHVVPMNMTRAAAGMGGYVLNTGKAVLDYVELSLKQYA